MVKLMLELELKLDASVNPNHPTDDIGEKAEAYIYIYIPFCL